MSLQVKKSKKAVSAMIGYILLVSIAVVMGGIVYTWMKSYVPNDPIECPDGISLTISELSCTSISGKFNINLILKNNGRFNISGYYIHAATENQELAVYDLSKFNEGSKNFIKFLSPFGVGKISNEQNFLNINIDPTSIDILPIIIDETGKQINCGDAKISEQITCQ